MLKLLSIALMLLLLSGCASYGVIDNEPMRKPIIEAILSQRLWRSGAPTRMH